MISSMIAVEEERRIASAPKHTLDGDRRIFDREGDRSPAAISHDPQPRIEVVTQNAPTRKDLETATDFNQALGHVTRADGSGCSFDVTVDGFQMPLGWKR